MSKIVFAMQPAYGHLNPTFKFARNLKERGHRIYYLGINRYQEYVRSQGFEYLVFPSRSSHQDAGGMQLLSDQLSEYRNIQERSWRIIAENEEELRSLIKTIQPDLFVVDANLPGMILATSEMGIPGVMLSTTLPIDDPLKSIEGVVDTRALERLSQTPELILCPENFDFPEDKVATHPRYYIGPSIDLERVEPSFQWDEVKSGSFLIYCSLGTHSHECSWGSLLFRTAIEAISSRPDWQGIISLGPHLRVADFVTGATNVMVTNMSPQLQILGRADCMILHGGLGSIKECIRFGVPMIVLPWKGDMVYNAARIVYHGLGVRGNPRKISVESLLALIGKIEKDDSYRNRLESMKQKFITSEQTHQGIEIIESLLSTRTPV